MGERRRAGECTIDDANLGDAGIGERGDNRPGRTAGAENDCRACRRIPTRCHLAEVLTKAKGIRIAPFETAVRPDDDRIYRTNSPGQRVGAVDNGQSRLLMRNCQVATPKAEDRKGTKRLLEMLRTYGQR